MKSRLLITILLGIVTLLFGLFVPPSNIFLVLCFAILITGVTTLISSLFAPKKIQYLTASFTFLFLVINYLAGFQLVNTILLISFIIGLGLLL